MKEWTFEANIDRISWLTDQVNEELEKLNCPMKVQMQIDVAIDELLANIASYAYDLDAGETTVRFDFDADTRTVSLTFIDSGVTRGGRPGHIPGQEDHGRHDLCSPGRSQ